MIIRIGNTDEVPLSDDHIASLLEGGSFRAASTLSGVDELTSEFRHEFDQAEQFANRRDYDGAAIRLRDSVEKLLQAYLVHRGVPMVSIDVAASALMGRRDHPRVEACVLLVKDLRSSDAPAVRPINGLIYSSARTAVDVLVGNTEAWNDTDFADAHNCVRGLVGHVTEQLNAERREEKAAADAERQAEDEAARLKKEAAGRAADQDAQDQAARETEEARLDAERR